MARAGKSYRIPVVAEVREAIDRFRRVEDTVENVGDTARRAGQKVDGAFDTASAGAKSAEDAAKQVEGAFRRLRVKTEETADEQRRRLIEAYEKIEQSGTATPEEIGRAWQSLRGRLDRINKQIGREAADPYIKAKRSAKEAAQEIRANFRRLGENLRSRGGAISGFGTAFTTRVSAPIAFGFGAAIKTAGDFEASILSIEAVLEPTREELTALKDEAIRLGSETAFSASEAANAIQTLGKNGLTVEQILNGAADSTLSLAGATGVSLPEAADIATDAMSTFQKDAGELPELMDQIVGVTNSSKLGIQDYAYFLGQAGGAASTAGLSLEDLNAGVVATASYFKEGSNAGAAFKNFLLQLSGLTSGKKELIADAGFDFYDDSGNLRGLPDIAETLKEGLKGKSQQEITNTLGSLFGTRAIATAQALAKNGADGVNEALENIGQGDAAEQAGKKLEGFNGQVKQLQSRLETLAIRIGESGILEAMTSLVESITGVVTYLSESSPAILRWGTIIALLVAALGPLIIAAGAVTSAVGTLATALSALGIGFTTISGAATAFAAAFKAVALRAVALKGVLFTIGRVLATVVAGFVSAPVLIAAGIGAALAAAATAVYYYWDEIKAFVSDAGAWIGRQFSALASLVADAFTGGFDLIRSGYNNLVATVSGVGTFLSDAITSAFDAAYEYITSIDWSAVGSQILDGLGVAGTVIREAVAAGKDLGEVLGFAAGGYVAGPGTATSDSIPARLSNGEYVMNAGAVSRFGRGVFDSLNAGVLPAPALGGMPIYSEGAESGGGGGGGRPIVLNLWGENLNARVDEDTAKKIERHNRRRGAARASRMPRYTGE